MHNASCSSRHVQRARIRRSMLQHITRRALLTSPTSTAELPASMVAVARARSCSRCELPADRIVYVCRLGLASWPGHVRYTQISLNLWPRHEGEPAVRTSSWAQSCWIRTLAKMAVTLDLFRHAHQEMTNQIKSKEVVGHGADF
eukprot:SAG31_NODE_1620_length_7725_cov_1.520850_5_plen_144_part_00